MLPMLLLQEEEEEKQTTRPSIHNQAPKLAASKPFPSPQIS
jgi:hypothetical protein